MTKTDMKIETATGVEQSSKKTVKAFTPKTVLFGLFGVFLINAFSGFNDEHLKGTYLVGNHFPTTCYFFIFVLIALWNPIAKLCFRSSQKLSEKVMFSTAELAATLGIFLMGSWTPASGFYRYFHRQLILPWFKLLTKPTWEKFGILEYIPEKLFPVKADSSAKMYEDVYDGFINGLVKGTETLMPWDLQNVLSEWTRPLIYWGPLVVLFSFTLIALAMMVHRQWAHHEQLSYPLAQISFSFIKREEGKMFPTVCYSRLFQGAFLFVFFIQSIRLGHVWLEDYIPDIKLHWTMGWSTLFPVLKDARASFLNNGRLFFTIIGVCYFLASGTSFTMGAANFILAFFMVQFYLTTGKPMTDLDGEVARSGGYVCFALILFWTGRNYYLTLLKQAFCLGDPKEKYHKESVLASRIFIVSFFGFIAVLYWMGLNLFVAFMFGALTILMFLVFSRVICETGIPFLQTGWTPGIILAKLFGPAAIGAAPIVVIYWLGTILAQDPRECLMPYVANSLKIADDARVKLQNIMKWAMVVCIFALAVGFVAKLTNIYNWGASEDGWSYNKVSVKPFDSAVQDITFLSETGMMEDGSESNDSNVHDADYFKSKDPLGLKRLSNFTFNGRIWGFFLFGAAGVLILSMIRSRFNKWPIHPVMFLVWGTFPVKNVFYSFLIGWVIKELVVKFGGGRVYNNLKPLFSGLIAGELIAAAMGIIIGIVYYMVTGQPPERFSVFPG